MRLGEAARSEADATATATRTDPCDRQVASAHGSPVLPLSRSAKQHGCHGDVQSGRDTRLTAARLTAAPSALPDALETSHEIPHAYLHERCYAKQPNLEPYAIMPNVRIDVGTARQRTILLRPLILTFPVFMEDRLRFFFRAGLASVGQET